MGVPCTHCGREYDVTLFEFGRTISCSCGHRVGLEPRVRRLAPDAPPRFAADAMLGRLARWLRLLGFDCAHDPGASDEALVRLASTQDRILLTRDRRLPEEWWIGDVRVLRQKRGIEQLREVVEHFGLSRAIRPLTRCGHCNAALGSAQRSAVADRIPPRVLAQHDRFQACPRCGRVFWEGSHAARIRSVAEGLA